MEQLKNSIDNYWSKQDTKTKISISIGIGIGSFITLSYLGIKYLNNKPKINARMLEIEEIISGEIWTRQYKFEMIGIIYYAKCTVIKLSNNKYMVHSPSPIDNEWETFFNDKQIEYIVAPSNFHWLNIVQWNEKYPSSKILTVPGIECKANNLKSSSIYGILHDNYIDHDVNSVFNKDFALSVIRGFTAQSNEVVLLHKKTTSLIIVDCMEYIARSEHDKINRMGHLYNYFGGMHNKIKPDLGYTLTLKHKNLSKQSFDKILNWNFNKIIINHGVNIYPQKHDKNINDQQAMKYCKQICQQCWKQFV